TEHVRFGVPPGDGPYLRDGARADVQWRGEHTAEPHRVTSEFRVGAPPNLRDPASGPEQYEPGRPESCAPDEMVERDDLPDERRDLWRAILPRLSGRPVHGRLQLPDLPPVAFSPAELR